LKFSYITKTHKFKLKEVIGKMSKEVERCSWCLAFQEYIDYHDEEWGVPVHDDKILFEMLILEGAQAGLSWSTVLKKRVHYRKVYDNFNAKKIARYTEKKKEKLLLDPGIIRNKLKVNASIVNAKLFLKIQKEYGSFDKYIWSFVDGKPIKNKYKSLSEVPATTLISDTMSKDLKKRGFKFVGSTICYAYMQAVGMVNDHITSCHRYKAVHKMK